MRRVAIKRLAVVRAAIVRAAVVRVAIVRAGVVRLYIEPKLNLSVRAPENIHLKDNFVEFPNMYWLPFEK
jgi:hypothetical protein